MSTPIGGSDPARPIEADSRSNDTQASPHDGALDPALRATYKIGAVARLTGITTHTLRKWQERYGMVAPERTERGDRLYTREDVQKLMTAKDLVEAGMAIAKVASMSPQELERTGEEVFAQGTRARRLSDSGVTTALSPKVRLAVVGPALQGVTEKDRHAQPCPERLDVKLKAIDAAEFLRIEDCSPVDVLVWEVASLQAEDRETLGALMAHAQATAGIVVYGFGAKAHVESLRARNIALLRGPVDAEELQRVVLGLLYELGGFEAVARAGGSRAREIAPPRFTTQALVRIAGSSPKLSCECPTHSAELIMRLGAFEDYTAYCESLSGDDAALHMYLNRTAGQARMLFEQVLTRLAEADDIDLGPAPR